MRGYHHHHWTAAEYAMLRALRERFLNGTAGHADYWKSPEELALYDRTFGERIGWKWDAVLRDLARRGWTPKSRRALDWGCGSGAASRRVLAAWPQFEALALHDRSALALRFAAERAREAAPALRLSTSTAVVPGTLLLVSHVLNELPPKDRAQLLAAAVQAQEVIWVEAGTHADSRCLSEVREHLRAHGHHAIAPCTHSFECGMLMPRNAPHWCHFFGDPPPEAFQEASWAELGRELGIDLRSLPFSFLVMAREPAPLAEGRSRVIGATRDAKGYSKVLQCGADGVSELMLQKRDAPELLRQLKKGGEIPVQQWQVEQGKIRAGGDADFAARPSAEQQQEHLDTPCSEP